MSDKELLKISRANEAEWRQLLWRKMEQVEDKQENLLLTVTTLKVKFGIAAGIFGFIGGAIVSLVTAAIGGK